MTAIGNDYAFEDVFVRQLENYGQKGDVVCAISVSGNSPNVVKAVEWANKHELETIGLVGAKRGCLAQRAHTLLSLTPPTTAASKTPKWPSATCFATPSWRTRIWENDLCRSQPPY